MRSDNGGFSWEWAAISRKSPKIYRGFRGFLGCQLHNSWAERVTVLMGLPWLGGVFMGVGRGILTISKFWQSWFKGCYRLNVSVPQKTCMLKSKSSCNGIRRWDFRGWLSSEGGASRMGSVPFCKKRRGSSLTICHVRTQQEGRHLWTRKRPLAR